MERFWAKVDKRGPDDCWEWTAGRHSQFGYGVFRFDGETTTAHRVAYLLDVGEIPEGMFVLHSCDNPPCVNPAHLRVGTHQDNMDDMAKRGRPNGNAKLNRLKVNEIRERYSRGGITQRTLAKEYGMSQAQISNIVRREHWSRHPG